MLFLNGITGYLYGPISCHENNIAAMNMIWVNTQILLLQVHVMQESANGENAMFVCCSLIVFFLTICVLYISMSLPWCPLGGVLDECFHLENVATNSCKTSITWVYGDSIILFRVMDAKYNTKFLLTGISLNKIMLKQVRLFFI